MNTLVNRLLFAAAFVATVPAIGAEKGTADDAVALVKKVIAYYKTNGKEKTFAAINSQSPDFRYKDLYVFGNGTNHGPLMAHGTNPRMVGKDLTDAKDADGVPFVKKIIEIANSKEGKGWVDYKWPNPMTKAIEQKTTYVERVDDVYFAVGVYK
jgi:signal transduction histidine kinase